MNVAIDTDFLIRLAIEEHPGRPVAEAVRDRHLDAGDRFALAPQVIAEFLHVATDGRRFQRPMDMGSALGVAMRWWHAEEVEHLIPSQQTIDRFHRLMTRHQLGRRRILNTLLVATCLTAGVRCLITGNAADYAIFPGLRLIELR